MKGLCSKKLIHDTYSITTQSPYQHKASALSVLLGGAFFVMLRVAMLIALTPFLK